MPSSIDQRAAPSMSSFAIRSAIGRLRAHAVERLLIFGRSRASPRGSPRRLAPAGKSRARPSKPGGDGGRRAPLRGLALARRARRSRPSPPRASTSAVDDPERLRGVRADRVAREDERLRERDADAARRGAASRRARGRSRSRVSGNPNEARFVATIQSHASASSEPPPSERPSTFAITTFGVFANLRSSSWPRRVNATMSSSALRVEAVHEPRHVRAGDERLALAGDHDAVDRGRARLRLERARRAAPRPPR